MTHDLACVLYSSISANDATLYKGLYPFHSCNFLLELDEVDVSCIFCWQPINYINDQENMDVNESYTDPQPTCSMPRKTLPGRTYILGNPARPPATFLLHASYNVVSTFLLQWFLPWTTLLCLIPKSTPCPRCLLFTEFIFKTFVVFSSM